MSKRHAESMDLDNIDDLIDNIVKEHAGKKKKTESVEPEEHLIKKEPTPQEKGISLSTVLGLEHAVSNMQTAIRKIVKEAPEELQLKSFINAVKTAATPTPQQSETLVALSRNSNVELAAKLKSIYNQGKLTLFDQLTSYASGENILTPHEPLALPSTIRQDCANGDASKTSFPPPLPPIDDPTLEARVFTHKSCANQSYLSQSELSSSHNERLEFLGDSVMNTVVTLIVYERLVNVPEGEMSQARSALVNNNRLTDWALMYKFDQKLRTLVSDEAFKKGNMKMYADVFEAYIGALFVEGKMQQIQKWLGALAQPVLDQIDNKSKADAPLNKSAKADLYSLIGCAASSPKYITKDLGDGLAKPYVVAVEMEGEELGRGAGPNIRDAGLRAAMNALSNQPAIDKFSLKRRQIPREISSFKSSPTPASQPAPPTRLAIAVSHTARLPLIAPTVAVIDLESKGRLYATLSRKKIFPEYRLDKLVDGFRATLSIGGVDFVVSEESNKKKASQRAAMYLLENPGVLADSGVL